MIEYYTHIYYIITLMLPQVLLATAMPALLLGVTVKFLRSNT